MKKVAYYITAHGYGHGARSCDVLNALHTAAPKLPIIVKTDLPLGFMASRLPKSIEVRSGAFDVGLVQKDSIHVDLDASLKAIRKLYSRESELICQETQFFQNENIGLVVADIPAIPLAAAQQAGLPNIATGNFGWDWIYSDFIQHNKDWLHFSNKFRSVYEKTDLLLRQPFAEPMSAFPNTLDLPLLAKPGTSCREKIAEQTGANLNKPWVLLSFTTLDLNKQALNNIFDSRMKYEFFSVEPLSWPDSNIHCISRSFMSFADMLASSDIVITKPGFGILSECIANNKPIIYSERKNFLEYPILVKAIERYCRFSYISNADLYSGRLEQAIKTLQNAGLPLETMERGGSEAAAQHILKKIRC
ncbi:MAG TPA: hypothetical protein VIR63_06305 [Pontiella sp.]